MNVVEQIASDGRVRAALGAFRSEVERAVELAVAIQQIPAPTFGETQRANCVKARLAELGLADVSVDDIGNVFGRYAGDSSGPPVVVTAHMDTVFPAETDLSLRYETNSGQTAGRIYGPGLADNAMGVAGLLLLAEALIRFDLRPAADIWLVANVGEEGLGDLKGMRAVVDRFGQAKAYLVVEGGSYGHVFHGAVGVRRYRLEVGTPGGHAWGDFGRPSAVHLLGRLVHDISQLTVPREPKTTFNVGVIEGGTSINTIASSASLLLDLRSTDPAALEKLVAEVQEITAQVSSQPEVAVQMNLIGERPAGKMSRRSPLVSWAAQALSLVGCKKVKFMSGSTDANLPISRGLPAVCIGLAEAGNTHRLDEYLAPAHLPEGLGQLLLLALTAAGFQPA